MDIELSSHSESMLRERDILEEWLWLAIEEPDEKALMDDGNVHYMKAIQQFGGRVLRVVVNQQSAPRIVVTVFFDRRLRRQG